MNYLKQRIPRTPFKTPLKPIKLPEKTPKRTNELFKNQKIPKKPTENPLKPPIDILKTNESSIKLRFARFKNIQVISYGVIQIRKTIKGLDGFLM